MERAATVVDVYLPIDAYEGGYTLRVHPSGDESQASIVVRGQRAERRLEIPPPVHSSVSGSPYERPFRVTPVPRSRSALSNNSIIKTEPGDREPSVISISSSDESEEGKIHIKSEAGAATAQPPLPAATDGTKPVCANCGREGHELSRCIESGPNGYVGACPVCEVSSHNIEFCPRNPTEDQLWPLIRPGRARKPPIGGGISVGGALRSSSAMAVEREPLPHGNYPWSYAFAKKWAKTNLNLWETFDYGRGNLSLPIDPATSAIWSVRNMEKVWKARRDKIEQRKLEMRMENERQQQQLQLAEEQKREKEQDEMPKNKKIKKEKKTRKEKRNERGNDDHESSRSHKSKKPKLN